MMLVETPTRHMYIVRHCIWPHYNCLVIVVYRVIGGHGGRHELHSCLHIVIFPGALQMELLKIFGFLLLAQLLFIG